MLGFEKEGEEVLGEGSRDDRVREKGRGGFGGGESGWVYKFFGSLAPLHLFHGFIHVKFGKNSIFMKNGKTVIYCYSTGRKFRNFLDLG